MDHTHIWHKFFAGLVNVYTYKSLNMAQVKWCMIFTYYLFFAKDMFRLPLSEIFTKGGTSPKSAIRKNAQILLHWNKPFITTYLNHHIFMSISQTSAFHHITIYKGHFDALLQLGWSTRLNCEFEISSDISFLHSQFFKGSLKTFFLIQLYGKKMQKVHDHFQTF